MTKRKMDFMSEDCMRMLKKERVEVGKNKAQVRILIFSTFYFKLLVYCVYDFQLK